MQSHDHNDLPIKSLKFITESHLLNSHKMKIVIHKEVLKLLVSSILKYGHLNLQKRGKNNRTKIFLDKLSFLTLAELLSDRQWSAVGSSFWFFTLACVGMQLLSPKMLHVICYKVWSADIIVLSFLFWILPTCFILVFFLSFFLLHLKLETSVRFTGVLQTYSPPCYDFYLLISSFITLLL